MARVGNITFACENPKALAGFWAAVLGYEVEAVDGEFADKLLEHGAAPEDVLVVGNSLGTGVAVQFASALQELQLERGSAPQRPRGVVLLAPFSSIETLLDTYYIMGLVPLLAPLRIIPFMSSESFFPRSQASMRFRALGPTKVLTRLKDAHNPKRINDD